MLDGTIHIKSVEPRNRTLLFYNLFPKTTWKEISNKILANVPHDEIIVHISLPTSRIFILPFVKNHLKKKFKKISIILWSFNNHRIGETRGFNLLRKKINLSRYSILSYAHSKGSSSVHKNTLPIQDWTELMRYFVVERLDLARKAFTAGAWFCGVNLSRNMHPDEKSRQTYPDTKFIFEGNFVSVNLDKVRDLITKVEPVNDYYGVERYWGKIADIDQCVSLHNSRVNHYVDRYTSENYHSEDLFLFPCQTQCSWIQQASCFQSKTNL